MTIRLFQENPCDIKTLEELAKRGSDATGNGRPKIEIRLFRENPCDAEAWDAFVKRSPETTSDHLWGWSRVLSKTFGFKPYYLGAFEADRVVGILPLFKVPQGLGRYALASIPFGNYGGICADSFEIAQALLASAQKMVNDLHCSHLELRHRVPMEVPSLQKKEMHHRFFFPIYAEPEKIFKDIGTKSRNNIRAAMKQGLKIVESDDLGPLYAIHTQNFHRLGTPCFPKRYFEAILKEFRDISILHYAVYENQMIAFSLLLKFKTTLLCQFSGSLEAFFKFKPNNLLFWHEIEKGYGLGMKELDYCRSRVDSGSATFKRRIGFHEEPLGYQYFLAARQKELPARHPNNRKYQLAISLWQKLPLSCANILGPRLVRYFA